MGQTCRSQSFIDSLPRSLYYHTGCLFLIPDRYAPAKLSSEFLLDFLKVIITEIVGLVPVIDR